MDGCPLDAGWACLCWVCVHYVCARVNRPAMHEESISEHHDRIGKPFDHVRRVVRFWAVVNASASCTSLITTLIHMTQSYRQPVVGRAQERSRERRRRGLPVWPRRAHQIHHTHAAPTTTDDASVRAQPGPTYAVALLDRIDVDNTCIGSRSSTSRQQGAARPTTRAIGGEGGGAAAAASA